MYYGYEMDQKVMYVYKSIFRVIIRQWFTPLNRTPTSNLLVFEYSGFSRLTIAMIFTTAISTLLFCALSQLSNAAPVIEAAKRDVYSPPVLYPHSGTVWYSGQRHNVTWDNSNPPPSISNRAFILLRSGDLELPVVLAHDFSLLAGRVEVTVPDVITGDDYSIVLFGDSGNWGEEFTINGPVTF